VAQGMRKEEINTKFLFRFAVEWKFGKFELSGMWQ